MKLVILLFIVLASQKSWQQDSSETINETLDRLIQQTNGVASINNSSIFYYNLTDNHKKSEGDESHAKITNLKIKPNDQVSIANILHALGLKDSKPADDADQDVGESQITKEINFTVEKTIKPRTTNSESSKDNESIKNIVSKDGRPEFDDIPEEAILEIASETKNNLLHKYPEIIIDRITYHNNKRDPDKITEAKAVNEEQKAISIVDNKNNDKNTLAQELKSFLDELQKTKTVENAKKITPENTDHIKIAYLQDAEDSTKQPCSNILIKYEYLSSCNSVLLNKLPDYQNLQSVISRGGGPLLDTSFQLNEWVSWNARQNALMRMSMAQKLKRIHLISQLFNRKYNQFNHRPI